MHITQAAQRLRPGTSWNSTTDSDGTVHLVQADDGADRVEIPTMEELQPIMDSDKYATSRRGEYPVFGDQLDAIWKLLDNATDSQALAVKQAVLDVKAKYPKP